MANEIGISVIMCCYNAENYVKKAIDSILQQTYKNFELIIWNDGSQDSTEQLISGYSDSRIRYFKDSNKGIGVARTQAYSKARGKYIVCMDADDISYSDRLEIEYNYMESHPRCVICSSSVVLIDKYDRCIGYQISYTNKYLVGKLINRIDPIVNPASIIRRDVFEKVGSFPNIPMGEDWLTWNRMIQYGYAFNLKKPLIKYRVLSGSLSHMILGSSKRQEITHTLKRIIQFDGKNEDDIKHLNLLVKSIQSKPLNEIQKKKKIHSEFVIRMRVYLLGYLKNIYGFIVKLHVS